MRLICAPSAGCRVLATVALGARGVLGGHEVWSFGEEDFWTGQQQGKKCFDPALLCSQIMSPALRSWKYHLRAGKRVGREEPPSLSGVYPGAFRLQSPIAKLPVSYQPAAFITLSPPPSFPKPFFSLSDSPLRENSSNP